MRGVRIRVIRAIRGLAPVLKTEIVEPRRTGLPYPRDRASEARRRGSD